MCPSNKSQTLLYPVHSLGTTIWWVVAIVSFIHVLSLNFLHRAPWLWGWGYEDHSSKILLPVFQLDSARNRHCGGRLEGRRRDFPCFQLLQHLSSTNRQQRLQYYSFGTVWNPHGAWTQPRNSQKSQLPQPAMRHPTLSSQHISAVASPTHSHRDSSPGPYSPLLLSPPLSFFVLPA